MSKWKLLVERILSTIQLFIIDFGIFSIECVVISKNIIGRHFWFNKRLKRDLMIKSFTFEVILFENVFRKIQLRIDFEIL